MTKKYFSLLATVAIIAMGSTIAFAQKTSTPANKSYEPIMIPVSGGRFDTGFNPGYPNTPSSKNNPSHRIHVSSFMISKYEVTHAQYKAVMGDVPNQPKGYNCDKCAVANISYHQAQEFLQKLNKLTGKKYRLPTETEWCFAAAGGTKSKHHLYAGSGDPDKVGWIYTNSKGKVHPIGQKRPNELGLYDMTGNVAEWCSDWYQENYFLTCPGKDPKGADTGSYRTVRGGSWKTYPDQSYILSLYSSAPNDNADWIGFRVAMSVSPAPKKIMAKK